MHNLTRACISAVTAGALCGVFGMTFVGLRDAVSQVSITDDVDDPAVWGQVYPLYYELYKKSVDMQRTKHGGSEAVPRTPTGTDPRTMVSRSKVEEDIGLRTMWQGYPFAVDFREDRGHAYMLEDQTYTMRQQGPAARRLPELPRLDLCRLQEGRRRQHHARVRENQPNAICRGP